MAALAGIGGMPDTIEDRAVVIRMRRRAPGETVAPYRVRRDGPGLNAIRVQLAEWLSTHLSELEAAEPVMPLEDRAADTWEPLVAVADLAGGEWPARVRAAALALTAEADDTAGGSDRIRLLADCRTAFADLDKIPTTTLLEHLKSDPEAPWATYGPTGNGLTGMKLGDLLREYDIRSRTLRFPAPIGQAKGYARADFTDAWERYTPSQNPAEGDQQPRLGLTEPYQPYQPSPTSSDPVRLNQRYGLSRTTLQAVPPLTCDATAGTAGTAYPTGRTHTP